MLVYASETGAVVGVGGDAELGCGVTRFESRRVDDEFQPSATCAAWPERWQALIDR